MPNLKTTLKIYNAKKQAFDEKTKEKRQEIATLMADVEALPNELSGQSEEYINRKKQQLMKKIEKKTQKMNEWIETQTKKIEDWMSVQQKKIQDGIDKVTALQEQTVKAIATLQAQTVAAILTGVKPKETEETESEEEEPITTPEIPVQKNDDDYQYSYINDLGIEIPCTGEQAAKRKAYSPVAVYTDPDEMINKCKINRTKK